MIILEPYRRFIIICLMKKAVSMLQVLSVGVLKKISVLHCMINMRIATEKMRVLNGMSLLVPPIQNFYIKKSLVHLILLKIFPVKCMRESKF